MTLAKIDWSKPIEHVHYHTPVKLLSDKFDVTNCKGFSYGVECDHGDGIKFCLLLNEGGVTPGGGMPIRNIPPAPVTLELWANVCHDGSGSFHQNKDSALGYFPNGQYKHKAVRATLTYFPES